MGSYLDKLLLGIKQVYRNGSPMPLRPVINFVNFYEVLDNPALGSTDIYTSTGGGSSGGTLLVIEHNSSPVTARPILNFIGGTVADNVGNLSTDVSLGGLVGPGAVITGNTTIASTQTFSVFADGPYTINLQNCAAGYEYILVARGAGTLSGAGQVTLSRGSASFVIEDPQPTGTGFTTGATVTCRTDFMTYRYALDTTANVLRCIT